MVATAITLLSVVDAGVASPSHPIGTTVPGSSSEPAAAREAPATSANYTFTFREMGLPNQTVWFVTFAGIQQFAVAPKNIVFVLPNGTYPFAVSPVPGYVANPPYGTLTSHNQTTVRPIQFTPILPPNFVVTLTESGLAAGTVWSATLNGATVYSSSASIVFLDPNGSYVFGIGAVSQYSASPESGTVVINGSAATVSIQFNSDKGLLGLPGVAGYLLVGALALEVLGALVLITLWIRSRRPPHGAPSGAQLLPPPAT